MLCLQEGAEDKMSDDFLSYKVAMVVFQQATKAIPGNICLYLWSRAQNKGLCAVRNQPKWLFGGAYKSTCVYIADIMSV